MELEKIINNRDLDITMSEKIDQLDGDPFALSDDSQLFAEIFVMDEFKFLRFKMLGPLKIESLEGCQLIFVGDKAELEMESDSIEIKTDYSRKMKIGITELDVDLDEELVDVIENKNISSVQIVIKKSNLNFRITNQKLLQTIINIEE